MDLTSLKRLATDAAEEAEGDWFDPSLIESHEPVSSTRRARRYIAALSPDKLLKLIAVVEAARASTDVFEEATGYVGCSTFSPSMESECRTALDALRSAMKELDK